MRTRIGQAFKAARKARGWNQSEVGRRAGFTFQYVSDVENARENANLTLDALEAFLRALDLEVCVVERGAEDAGAMVARMDPATRARALRILRLLPDAAPDLVDGFAVALETIRARGA